jgi:hypothetical protein
VLASFGEVHPKVLKALDVKGPAVAFTVLLENAPQPRSRTTTRPALELHPLQAVERDFAFVVDARVEALALVNAAQGADKALIEGVSVFDEFAGPKAEAQMGAGKKSLAISVRLQPKEKTLTDEEIERRLGRGGDPGAARPRGRGGHRPARGGGIPARLGASADRAAGEIAETVKRPLEIETWAGCVDAVGGAMLARVLGQLKYRCQVAAVGNAGGVDVPASVIPFLLRGVNLLGIDSVLQPYETASAPGADRPRPADGQARGDGPPGHAGRPAGAGAGRS